MSGGISVEVRSQAIVEALDRLGELRESGIAAAAVQADQLFRDHFYNLHAERHRTGGTGFYREAADTVFHRYTDSTITVGSQRQGLRQRLKGGEIRAKRRYLTIPIRPEAYGLRAQDSSLPPLNFIRTRAGRLILADTREEGQIIPYFVLVESVSQEADPSVIPTTEEIGSAVIRGLEDTLAILN